MNDRKMNDRKVNDSKVNCSKETAAALKLMLGSLAYQDLSITKTVEQVITQLCLLYQKSSDEKYLELALLYIKIYLEMGFVYDELAGVFDRVFTLWEKPKEAFYEAFQVGGSEKRKYSKNEIKSMIRRWSSSKYHTKTIDEVVEDILEKLEKQSHGIYYYHSNENPKQSHLDEVYELVIGEYESYLHDINRNKYYRLA